jgi:PAS domain-containing protein
VGAIAGSIAAAAFNRTLTRRAERLDAMAEALSRRQLPSHLLPDERDAMNRAERRLLDTADAIVTALESLDHQREEFEAILRGMIEAVVVTGVRGEVVMMNGAARQVFGLAAEANYGGRDFVAPAYAGASRLCRLLLLPVAFVIGLINLFVVVAGSLCAQPGVLDGHNKQGTQRG